MQTVDMHQAYIKSLMLLIGGIPRPGETDPWLKEMSENLGIGFRSLRAAWYGQWISKNKYVSDKNLEILERAAQNARQTHGFATSIDLQIAIWETAPELFRDQIRMAREFVARLRRYDQERSRTAIPAQDEDARTATAPARLAAKA